MKYFLVLIVCMVIGVDMTAQEPSEYVGGVAELAKLKPLRIEKFGLDRIFSDRV